MASARILAFAAAVLSAAPAAPDARVLPGATVANVELPALAGGKERLLGRADANVILFWRPGSDHSLETLRLVAECARPFPAERLHVVSVVSGSWDPEDVRAAVAEAKLAAPVLVDAGDVLYGKLEIRQHPLVVVADRDGRVTLSQPYVRVRYCDIVQAHVRHLLGEIDEAQLQKELAPARASFPSDDPANVARRWVTMGRREAAAGRCDRAVKSFARALELAPADAAAKAGMAACEGKAKSPPVTP